MGRKLTFAERRLWAGSGHWSEQIKRCRLRRNQQARTDVCGCSNRSQTLTTHNVATQPDASDSPGAALRAIGGRLLALADSLDAGAPAEERLISFALWERDQVLLRIWAEAEYRGRRKRKDFLSSDLFGEAAWDILLDLFIQRGKRKRVSVVSACKASDVPDTTALRWLAVLEEKGLVERQQAEHDKRVQFIELTEAGMMAVSRWLRYRAALPI